MLREVQGMKDYASELELLKALGEPTRLKIIGMLSLSEMCARNLLKGLSITQPTLSHHMKVLMDCGLVSGRKEATWVHYTINTERAKQLQRFIEALTHPKGDSIAARNAKAAAGSIKNSVKEAPT
jgi:ArsR family transcriptional regulator